MAASIGLSTVRLGQDGTAESPPQQRLDITAAGSLKLSTAVAAAGAVLAFVLVEPRLKARSVGSAHLGEGQAAEPTEPTAEREHAAA